MSKTYQGKCVLNGGVEGFFVSFLSPTYVVVVSGSALNPCGHMLLNIGGYGGVYAHIAEVNGYPYLMDHRGYVRYLVENKKVELRRPRVQISDPRAARRKFDQLLFEKWVWMVIPNNCVHFVEEILQAGGCAFELSTNCPALES